MFIHSFNVTVGALGVISTVSILIALVIKFIIDRRRIKASSSDSPIYHWRLTLDILTNLCLISFFIHAASVSLIRFNIFPPTLCPLLARCNASLYHTTRCTLYAILVIRIHISFNNSVYSYSKKYIIYPLFILIILWFIVALFFDMASNAVHAEYNTKYQTCAPIFKFYAVFISGTFDIFFCTILLILFITPLIRLNRSLLRGQRAEIQRICKINRKTQTTDMEKTECTQITRNNRQIELCLCVGINEVNINITATAVNAESITKHNAKNSCSVSSGSMMSANTTNSIASNVSISSGFGTPTIRPQISDEMAEIYEEKEVDSYQAKKGRDKREICLSSHVQTEHQRNLNNIYQELVTRYALLVVLCIGSSFILYLCVLLFGHWIADLLPVDDAVNVWCIILICQKTNKIYHKLCFSCNYLMKLCCNVTMNSCLLLNGATNHSVAPER